MKWLCFTAHRIFFLVSEAFVSILRSMGMIYALTWERHILKWIEIYKSLDLWRVTFLWEWFFWSIETFMIETRNSSCWRPDSGHWWALRSSNINFMAIWNVGGAFFWQSDSLLLSVFPSYTFKNYGPVCQMEEDCHLQMLISTFSKSRLSWVLKAQPVTHLVIPHRISKFLSSVWQLFRCWGYSGGIWIPAWLLE